MDEEFKDLEKKDLIKIITQYKKFSNFGLVWEVQKTQEIFEHQSSKFLPKLVNIQGLNLEKKGPKNILIEGDNYHALEVLRCTHSKKFEVIYIDPPYNTGKKDFKYNDNWVEKEDAFRHSKWLSFMDKRLRLAKDLLANNGILFISIDDHEYANLQLLCDKIFGEKNRIATLVWFYEGVNDNNAYIKNTHEYILVYQTSFGAKLSKDIRDPNVNLSDEIRNSVVKNGPKNPMSTVLLPKGFPCETESGIVKSTSIKSLKYSKDLKIENYTLLEEVEVSSGWSSKDILLEFIQNGFQSVKDSKGQDTVFVINKAGNIDYKKIRDQSYVLSVLRNLGTVAEAGLQLKDRGISFDYPKPVGLIKYLINFHADKNAKVLDFFAGSGTTGEAVLQCNSEDGGMREFVLVTTNDEIDQNGEISKICSDICYPRIKSVLHGYVSKKNGEISGLNGSLYYFKTDFIEKKAGRDEMKLNLIDNIEEFLMLKHNVFKLRIQESSFLIYENEETIVGIYKNLDYSELNKMQDIFDMSTDKSKYAYIATLDDDGLNAFDFYNWSGIAIEPLPNHILNILERNHDN